MEAQGHLPIPEGPPIMLPDPAYLAAICTQCQRASLLIATDSESSDCATCGARTISVPGRQFVRKDLPLFAELERLVHHAELSRSEATLIAAELESVSLRWEPPDMVLRRLSPRLVGLRAVYDPKQEYTRLLLIVGMLLTIVCARMIGSSTSIPARSSRPSGIRRVGVGDATPPPAELRRKRA
jgi:hypothetical protein